MVNRRKIMVCVTQQKSCERLIKRGAELCKAQDELLVVHVVKENWRYFGKLKEADALEYLFDISKAYDATLSVIKDMDIESALTKFAYKEQVDIIVMGESLESTKQQNMIHRLENKLNRDLIIEIVPLEIQVDQDLAISASI
ncbi:universal stress protein [Acidaminobacter hydrogenoformans]|uniref:Universal stress protein family protein n=1 Tax=Acidaminobacter hydrogenoformans DSM 2784 TaxID=1120920 RepID=A0A1G5S6N8_9FIRM|nr:universal stress protein [Acidaminobacter hydrogenoformans]SCZ81229.1 Universal stress protein family protein [Acidaminobacter hydrogenoformans DSM 2784]